MTKLDLILFILLAVLFLLLAATPVHAVPNTSVIVDDQGLQVIDDYGVGEINHVYKISCDGDYIVQLLLTWPSGVTEYRSGHYCDTTIYLTGTAATANVTFAGVLGEPPDAVYRVWLPVLSK